MPYTVSSNCDYCYRGDEFSIGFWTMHMGLFSCPNCRAFVNIPLETGRCLGCGYSPTPHEFYDYSAAIPYLGGKTLNKLEPGPLCPKCCQRPVSFETTMHLNTLSLGFMEASAKPWLGRDYLEKAIFVYALSAVCVEFNLRLDEALTYYKLDVPRSLLRDRRKVSLPILLDIRTHLLIKLMAGDLTQEKLNC